MVRQLSVLIDAGSLADLEEVLASVDAQTLTVDVFDVFVVDRGLAPEARGWLDLLSARRPNVTVVAGEKLSATDVADRVAVLAADHRLFPEALEQMMLLADRHGAEVVAGRVSRPRLPVSSPFLTDQLVLDAAARGALRDSVVLANRSLLRFEPAGPAIDAADGPVAILAGYPAAWSDREPTASPLVPSAAMATVEWAGDELAISAEIQAEPMAAGARPFLVVRQLDTGLTMPIEPTAWDRSAESDQSARWTAEFRINPATARAGGPLTRGLWTPAIILAGAAESSAVRRLRVGTLPPPAVLDLGSSGATILTFGKTKRGALQIDVGATKHPLLPDPAPDDARVAESVAGSLLTLPLPTLHVRVSAQLPGTIALDRFQFPATLATADGRAALTAQLSGLPGPVALSARFGGAPMTATGLDVLIEPDGAMRLTRSARSEATPGAAGEPHAAAAPATATERSRSRANGHEAGHHEAGHHEAGHHEAGHHEEGGPIARLRQSLPAPLEPVARRLRSNRTARAVYRRLTGLSG